VTLRSRAVFGAWSEAFKFNTGTQLGMADLVLVPGNCSPIGITNDSGNWHDVAPIQSSTFWSNRSNCFCNHFGMTCETVSAVVRRMCSQTSVSTLDLTTMFIAQRGSIQTEDLCYGQLHGRSPSELLILPFCPSIGDERSEKRRYLWSFGRGGRDRNCISKK
jgi:hypothetical protein